MKIFAEIAVYLLPSGAQSSLPPATAVLATRVQKYPFTDGYSSKIENQEAKLLVKTFFNKSNTTWKSRFQSCIPRNSFSRGIKKTFFF